MRYLIFLFLLFCFQDAFAYTSYQHYDDMIFDNHGNSWHVYDNVMYGSDGSVCEHYDGQTFCY